MTAFQQLPSSVLQTGLFFSPSVSLDSQTVSAKEYLFPYQKERAQTTQTSEGTTSQYLKPYSSFYSQLK
ncbi:TPA: ABC transporter substrate-binding protein [Streptococcus pneumoniae]|nr:ABC transporter substrate-binding protein [Streptococcus pneumoniae]